MAQGKAVKKQEVLELLDKFAEYINQCRETKDYPQITYFLTSNGYSPDFFNKHCGKWKETQEKYNALKQMLAESKLYSGLFARRVKATHLISLDLMNNHGWRERKEEQQHQYIHDIEKLREKLKDDD